MSALARWISDEVRLITASTWADERPEPPARQYAPCTADDPACRRTLARLAAASERMRRMGIPRLTDRPRPPFASSAHTDVGALFRRVVAITGKATIIRPAVFRAKRG